MSVKETACDIGPLVAVKVSLELSGVATAGPLDAQPLSPATAPALSSRSKPNIA